jgi:hypothetical protein
MQEDLEMKLRKLSLACSGLLLAGAGAPAMAEGVADYFSANVALTTDYVWRGISQTNEDPAIQGGFDFEHPSGVYLGVWGSNVDFDTQENWSYSRGFGVDWGGFTAGGIELSPIPPWVSITSPSYTGPAFSFAPSLMRVDYESDASMELDVYGGYATEIGGVGLDIGFIHYDYPGESDLNFEEVYLGLSFGPAGVQVSHDFDNDNTYYEGGVSFDIVSGFALGAHIGHYDFDAGEDYTDWKLGVTKSFGGFDFELAYTDTDLDDCSVCDSRAIFTVGKTF